MRISLTIAGSEFVLLLFLLFLIWFYFLLFGKLMYIITGPVFIKISAFALSSTSVRTTVIS